MIFGFWNTNKSMSSHRSIACPLLWYCDVTQTLIVTSFWPIVMKTFPSGSRASSRSRQVDYHSLIIENYSQRFHWLACNNISYYTHPSLVGSLPRSLTSSRESPVHWSVHGPALPILRAVALRIGRAWPWTVLSCYELEAHSTSPSVSSD